MYLDTTLGPLPLPERGCILPHEHVFVDLRTWDQPGYAEADPEAVVQKMAPEIERARATGVVAIVEPGGIGVGRRVDILLAVSRAARFPLVAPTGVYREPWLPPWVREASETDLAEWMEHELTGEIEGTGVRAGWIKVGASDEGLTAAEAKVLRAAAAASTAAVATVGSHTLNGPVARNQTDIFAEAGGSPRRFVWIHAHREPDVAIHHELGRRGVWLEYDGIGEPGTDQMFVDLVRRGLDAGLGDRILLSHDRGWYDPAQPDGGTPLPYTYLTERFLSLLSDAGIDDATIDRLTRLNPFTAFARPEMPGERAVAFRESLEPHLPERGIRDPHELERMILHGRDI